MENIKRIVFVCESATCRAPMAAAILSRQRLASDIEIISRGVLVLLPEPLNQKAEAVMISNGITLENYRSRELAAEDLTEDTLVLAMQQSQKDKIIEKFAHENVFLLNEYVGDELEIMDPYGGMVQSYGLCFEMLQKSIQKLIVILNKKMPGAFKNL